MSTTRRERVRESTKEEIKAIARRQMAEVGTAAISLRGIARDMGMTATALYRYFASHDDLITELIVDGYNAQADTLEAADAACPADDYSGRLLRVLLVYREWALEHRTDFQLLYGNPIPNYHAPSEITTPAAARNMAVIIKILAAAHQAGRLKLDEIHVPAEVQQYIAESQVYGDVPPVLLYLGTAGWARIHGVIMLELFEHLQPLLGDVSAFYYAEIRELMRSMGLDPASTEDG